MPRARDCQWARVGGVPGGLGVKGQSRSFDTVPLIDHVRCLIGLLCSYLILIGLQFLTYSKTYVSVVKISTSPMFGPGHAAGRFLGLAKSSPSNTVIFFTVRRHARAICAVGLFVRLSVTSLCSTDTAKRRITQTTPHGMDASFLDAKDLAVKLKRGHPQRRRQMQVEG